MYLLFRRVLKQNVEIIKRAESAGPNGVAQEAVNRMKQFAKNNNEQQQRLNITQVRVEMKS